MGPVGAVFIGIALMVSAQLALARPEGGSTTRASAANRSPQVQEMRSQMREYRKNWIAPRPATVTDGMPPSLSPRPARTRLTESERDLLRQELRDLRIKPAP